jgi:folate-dependent phosphoribosylglycinamide formyltransferase PurN
MLFYRYRPFGFRRFLGLVQAATGGLAPMAKRRVVLLVNDSPFAAIMAAPLIQTHEVVGVVLSRATVRSVRRLFAVVRRASWRYLVYRALVQCSRRRVATLAQRAGISVWPSANINEPGERTRLRDIEAEVAVAINFDQILRAETLAVFARGVLNAHASRLPADRGVSPALWAFARGDAEIWVTLYRMDAGLDTGPIYEQFAVALNPGETAFTMYGRVCAEAGTRLAALLASLELREPAAQIGPRTAPHPVPDRTFDAMLRRSGRSLILV